MRITHKYYPYSILITVIVCYLSLFNPSEMGIENFNIWDKLVHTIMYFGVSSVFWFEYLWNHYKKPHTSGMLLFTMVFPVVLGGVLELAQEYLTECRSGEWVDFIANSLGVIFGAVAGWWIGIPVIGHLRQSKDNKDE